MIVSGLDDWVGLWEVVREARESSFPAHGGPIIRKLVMDSIRFLLDQGLVEVGEVTEGHGFTPWGLPASGILRKIEARWDRLGRDPDIGEVAWLRNTQQGDEQAARQQGPGD